MQSGKLKWFSFFSLLVAVIVIIFAIIVLSKKPEEKSNAKSDAVSVIQTIFSCTQQQASSFDAAMAGQQSADTEVGLASGDDAGIADYFTTQYGALLTPECLAQGMANRTLSRSAALSKENQCDIAATEIEVKEHADTPNVFSFSAVLTDVSNQTSVATVSGIISMEVSNVKGTSKTWRASNISATVTSNP